FASPTFFMVRPVDNGVRSGGAERSLLSARAEIGDMPLAGKPTAERACAKNPPPVRTVFAAEIDLLLPMVVTSADTASAASPAVWSAPVDTVTDAKGSGRA